MQVESRGALQDVISENAVTNSEYREALLRDPKSILQKHLGRDLPDWLNVEVVEEKSNTVYVIAPHIPSDELADDDLEAIAGGKGGTKMDDVHCERNYGAFNSVITLESSVSV